MDFKAFYATENDDKRRIDKILRHLLPFQNLSGIYKLIRKGLVKVNGQKTKPENLINKGDEIKIASFLLENSQANEKTTEKSTDTVINPESRNNHDLKIAENDKKNGTNFELSFDNQFKLLKPVFQNENILILNKPYGICVHGKDESLDAIVKNFYKMKESTSLSFIPGPLHRLDERTTGLLCFSWSLKGARWFSENIKNHSIKKEYLAIVEGKMTENQSWTDYIDSENKNADKTSFKTVKIQNSKSDENSNYKEAKTDAFPLCFGKYKNHDFTLVKFLIHTGRTHQIRSQSAEHDFPLLGDTSYGGKFIEGKRKFFLHAYRLSFPENPLGLPESIKCNPDDFFINFLKTNNCEINNIIL